MRELLADLRRDADRERLLALLGPATVVVEVQEDASVVNYTPGTCQVDI